MSPEKQLDVRRPEHIQWWDIGDGQRAFAGPVDRVYGALEVAQRRGVEFEVVSESPVRRGQVVVTVRFLERLPVPRSATAANGRRRSVRRALAFVAVGIALAAGAVWAVIALFDLIAAHIAVLLGAVAIVVLVSMLFVKRGCEIYVTHIRR